MTASAVTAGALQLSFRGDRRLADHYRATLAQAHGSYLRAVRLHDASGMERGVVFLYRGAPSWIMITVAAPYHTSVKHAELISIQGKETPLSWFHLAAGAWGGPLPIDLRAVAAVHLLGRDGRPLLTADTRRAPAARP